MGHVVPGQLAEHVLGDLEDDRLAGLAGLAAARLLGLDREDRVEDALGRVDLGMQKKIIVVWCLFSFFKELGMTPIIPE